MEMDRTQLLIATIGLLMVANLVVVIAAFVSSRVGFGAYLKRQHPEQWERLVPDEAALSLPLAFDASLKVRKFRTGTTEDLGDPELRRRRRRANSLERIAIYGWLGTGVWAVAVFLLSIALDR